MTQPKRPNTKKRRKKLRRPGPIAWLLSLAAIAGAGYFLFQLITINILPTVMLLMISMIIVLSMMLLIMIWLLKTRRPVTKFITGLLVVVLGAGMFVGGRYLGDTESMFQTVTDLTDKKANTFSVLAMQTSGITKPDQLTSTSRVGMVPSIESTGLQECEDQLRKEGASYTPVSYDNVYELVDALYDGSVEAIIFPENYHNELYEAANDYNAYNALTTFTNTIDQYIYYTDRDPSTVVHSDPVGNIMTDPFTVLVSGNDSYGTLDQSSRSDVNMLVVVNPRTAQILILNIPRDTYLNVSCSKNPSACEAVAGQQDKLTHAGIYGVGAVETSLEDYFGIDINYYVRLNFSSLINIVDAIGGVDVEVEPGLEVDRFYANGTEGVHAGTNHLDGERALAFARERHVYADGDNQRVRNQQIVMKALIRQMISPAMVVNYPKVMKALSTAFETNMTAQEIKSLLTLELARFPKWNIQAYALSGEPQTEFSPAVGDLTSVTVLDSSQISIGRALVEAVLNGETINLDDISTYISQDQNQDWQPQTQPESTTDDQNYGGYEEPSWDDQQQYSDQWYDDQQEPVYQEPVYQEPVYEQYPEGYQPEYEYYEPDYE